MRRTLIVGKVHLADIFAGTRSRFHLEWVWRRGDSHALERKRAFEDGNAANRDIEVGASAISFSVSRKVDEFAMVEYLESWLERCLVEPSSAPLTYGWSGAANLWSPESYVAPAERPAYLEPGVSHCRHDLAQDAKTNPPTSAVALE